MKNVSQQFLVVGGGEGETVVGGFGVEGGGSVTGGTLWEQVAEHLKPGPLRLSRLDWKRIERSFLVLNTGFSFRQNLESITS